EVGRKYNLPVLLPRNNFETTAPQLLQLTTEKDILIDEIIMAGEDVKPDGWEDYYTDAIKNLKPGVTEIIIHCAFNDSEMQAVSVNHPGYGAEWRQRDFDFFGSKACAKLLKDEKIILITWGDIKKLLAE
ncbi:MAG: hypothetical protein OEW75_19510, partial [Cyclobacteriaceae bacterium]|nr:hypothetical protein [Cyclobacteriaceae bacterium]